MENAPYPTGYAPAEITVRASDDSSVMYTETVWLEVLDGIGDHTEYMLRVVECRVSILVTTLPIHECYGLEGCNVFVAERKCMADPAAGGPSGLRLHPSAYAFRI